MPPRALAVCLCALAAALDDEAAFLQSRDGDQQETLGDVALNSMAQRWLDAAEALKASEGLPDTPDAADDFELPESFAVFTSTPVPAEKDNWAGVPVLNLAARTSRRGTMTGRRVWKRKLLSQAAAVKRGPAEQEEQMTTNVMSTDSEVRNGQDESNVASESVIGKEPVLAATGHRRYKLHRKHKAGAEEAQVTEGGQQAVRSEGSQQTEEELAQQLLLDEADAQSGRGHSDVLDELANERRIEALQSSWEAQARDKAAEDQVKHEGAHLDAEDRQQQERLEELEFAKKSSAKGAADAGEAPGRKQPLFKRLFAKVSAMIPGHGHGTRERKLTQQMARFHQDMKARKSQSAPATESVPVLASTAKRAPPTLGRPAAREPRSRLPRWFFRRKSGPAGALEEKEPPPPPLPDEAEDLEYMDLLKPVTKIEAKPAAAAAKAPVPILAATGASQYRFATERPAESQEAHAPIDEEEAEMRRQAFSAAGYAILDLLQAQDRAGSALRKAADRLQIGELASSRLQLLKVRGGKLVRAEANAVRRKAAEVKKVLTDELTRRQSTSKDPWKAVDMSALLQFLQKEDLTPEAARSLENFAMQAVREKTRHITGSTVLDNDHAPRSLDEAIEFAASRAGLDSHDNTNFFVSLIMERNSAVDRLYKARNTTGFDWSTKDGAKQLQRDWEVLTTTNRKVTDPEREPLEVTPPLCTDKPLKPSEAKSMHIRITASRGRPNLRAWCYSGATKAPFMRYTTSSARTVLEQCILGRNPMKSAHIVYEQQVKSQLGDLDASYCFLEGHCDSVVLGANATMDDGERACDMKYGREAWSGLGFHEAQDEDWLKYGAVSMTEGLKSFWPAHFMGMLSCAMGSFHCDAVLCKETYCRNPYFKKQYGGLRQALAEQHAESDMDDTRKTSSLAESPPADEDDKARALGSGTG